MKTKAPSNLRDPCPSLVAGDVTRCPTAPHDLGTAAGCTQGSLARFLIALDGKLIWQVFGERLLHTCHTCTGVAQGKDEPTYAEPVLALALLVRSHEG